MTIICNPDLANSHIPLFCLFFYFYSQILDLRASARASEPANNSPWAELRSESGTSYFYNFQTNMVSSGPPSDVKSIITPYRGGILTTHDSTGSLAASVSGKMLKSVSQTSGLHRSMSQPSIGVCVFGWHCESCA
jgi:hypothetical protein